MCAKLAEKDALISKLQEGHDQVDLTQKTSLNNQNDLIREKKALEEKINEMK